MTLSVIGAGFGRTGTMSLKLALERLGFGPCYHMIEVFKSPEDAPFWEAAAEGRSSDWESVLGRFRASVDWPGATFYKQLADHYPDAKVILTVRDPESWFRSTQETIFARPIPDDTQDPWARMVLKVIGDLFDRQMSNKDKLIEVFNRHNEAVERTIPPERLLVYEVADGWAPLCAFLGVDVPDEPMPCSNTTAEFQQHLASTLEQHTSAQ